MALPNLYSRRKRRAEAQQPEVYFYDRIPNKLRIQIIQIIREVVGKYDPPVHDTYVNRYYDEIARILRKDFGEFALIGGNCANASVELFSWFLSERDIERLLDFIELSMFGIDNYVRENFYYFGDVVDVHPDAAIAELNARFSEASFGYSYQDGQLVRIDSQVIHAEVVVPALKLLTDGAFNAAEAEYRAAHDAYRHRDYETAIVECGKAFESVLKVIGAKREWGITPNDPATKLLDAAYAAGFIEPALQAEFSALRSLLASGVPTVRNKNGGHGAGTTPRQIPEELVAFQLHQTAAAILFLARHDAALP